MTITFVCFHDPALLTLLQSVTKEITNLKACSVLQSTTPKTEDLPSINSINPHTQQPYKRYRWTRGYGNHWSDRRHNPKPGHKTEATFKNRFGGSNKECLPVKD